LSAPSGSTHQLDRSLPPSIRRRYIYIYPGFTNHALLSNHARNSSGMTEPSAVVAAEEGVPHASNNQKEPTSAALSTAAKDKNDLDAKNGNKDKDEDDASVKPQVPLKKLFSYADRQDVIFMAIGTFAACVHSV
ncbi:unnamed protein product, partial [Ascophyllum nodosum]